MSQATRSGGQILVDGLRANRVRHVFCVPGESYLAALDAFYQHQKQIQLIVCRQEGGAAYMAEAYGKLSGQPGICFVSRGPGAANAMVGIHTAFQDSTPLLLFVGQIPRRELGREAFQELDYRKVYGGVAKAVFQVQQAADIPQQLFDAWTTAISHRPGPVVVELPEDLLAEQAVAADREPATRIANRPTAESLRRFTKLLKKSARPVVIGGGAAWTPQTNSALADFAEKHCLPVACAFRRQDMFDNTHPHYVGDLGLAPTPHLLKLVKDADLVIALSARLGEITTGSYTLFAVPEFDASGRGRRKLAHIFPSAQELNSVYHADLGIDSDAETFLQAMAKLEPEAAMEARAIPARQRQLQRQRIATARQHYLAELQSPKEPDAPLRMDQIMQFLRARLPADSIIANGAGNFARWCRLYQFRQANTQLASTNGSMGYGAPAAIAGKIVRPQSIVVSFSGDGCFLMNGQELATAVQYDIRVIFLVLNNNQYGTIRSHQQRRFPGRPIATSLNNPDFAALARAYHAFGACVTRAEEFEAVFEQALRAKRPAVIELKTD